MESFKSSQRRREFAELTVIVLFLSIISNIIVGYLQLSILDYDLLSIPLGIWLILGFVSIAIVMTYYLALTPDHMHVAIYSNLMFQKSTNSIFSSTHAPCAIQRCNKLWTALKKDGSPLSQQIIKNQGDFKKNELLLDMFDYLIFSILTGFDIFWASGKVKSYGYPTHPSHLGEVTTYEPSTIYKYQLKSSKEDNGTKELKDQVENNKIIEHFSKKTSLDYLLTPQKWLLFTPLGTEITVNRNNIKNGGQYSAITLKNNYVTIDLEIHMHSTGFGLPHGIRIHEDSYNEKDFTTTTFRIDFKANFSGWLSISPKMDCYHNWSDLIKKRLVANFSLRRKGVIEEIE